MNSRFTRLAGLGAVGALLLAAPNDALAQATGSIQGNIISHTGQQLVVQAGGANTTVTLTDATKIQAVAGALGLRREDHPPTDLIPGLLVNIDTITNGSEVDAASITFKPGDLKTAQAVQAGTEAAKQKFRAEQAQNEKRLSEVGQFVQKGITRVYFATGSATINAAGKQSLQAIAAQGMAIPSGLFRVVGHTDSTGSAAVNQRLSDQRASAVTAYLLTNCGVPGNKIMSATGMGSDLPQDADDMGGAKNRRVAVMIMVSKASLDTSSSGGSSNSPQQ
jgi:outer membrane protein OmpA-like peptidoglycan-associated protein